MLRLQLACGNELIAVGIEQACHVSIPIEMADFLPSGLQNQLEDLHSNATFRNREQKNPTICLELYLSASWDDLLFSDCSDVNMLQVLVLCGLALVLLYRVGLGHVGHRAPDLPPGPPTLPLIGNLHQLPLRHLYRQFSKWAHEYGPVYSLILGTKVFIIISSDQAVKDLLDQRGGIYSSRPENYIGEDVFSGGLRVVLMV